MSMEMDTCRKSGIEEISNYAVRLQDKGDKEARENIDKLMIFYVLYVRLKNCKEV